MCLPKGRRCPKFVSRNSAMRKTEASGWKVQAGLVRAARLTAVAFGIGLVMTAGPVRAADDDDDDMTFEEKIIDNIMRGVELEKKYADDALPRGIVGLTPTTVKQYIEHIADRRLERINLERQYHKDNPFPWMSEIIDMPKEKNFFETRVTEYKTGELDW
jgi:ribonucleoside-diphosphate reductase beta chain